MTKKDWTLRQIGRGHHEISTASGKKIALFLTEEMLPDERSQEKLLQIASLPELLSPLVVLPDLHFKIKNFVPSGMLIALSGSYSPMLVGPPNDGMLLASTKINVNDFDETTMDRFFSALMKEVAMYRRKQPNLNEEQVVDCLLNGASSLEGISEEDKSKFPLDGNAFTEPVSLEEILAVFPSKERPLHLPDFVPWFNVIEAGQHSVGVLDGGSHFVELNTVEEILEPTLASALGLNKGQILFAVHSGGADVGIIGHKHYLPDSLESDIELFDADSQRGKDFLTAYCAGANIAFANRASIFRAIGTALESAGFSQAALKIVSDAPHDYLDVTKDSGAVRAVHRKGGVIASPASSFPDTHVFSETGFPFYFPSALAGDSFVMSNKQGNPEAFFACSHGTGRRINKDQAVATYSEQDVMSQISERNVRLYRYGETEFGGQSPDSYKNINEILSLLREANLASPIVRLRPLGILKG